MQPEQEQNGREEHLVQCIERDVGNRQLGTRKLERNSVRRVELRGISELAGLGQLHGRRRVQRGKHGHRKLRNGTGRKQNEDVR